MIITLPFLPPSVNMAYYTDKSSFTRHKSKKYRQFVDDCQAFMCQGSILGEVEIEINFYFPDKRKRDAFNYEKCLTDTLVHYGVIEDDSLIQRGVVEKYYSKGKPETLIEIKQYEAKHN